MGILYPHKSYHLPKDEYVTHILNRRENKVQRDISPILYGGWGRTNIRLNDNSDTNIYVLDHLSICTQEYIHCLKNTISPLVGKEKKWKMELYQSLRHKLECWQSGHGVAILVSLFSISQLWFRVWKTIPVYCFFAPSLPSREVKSMLLLQKRLFGICWYPWAGWWGPSEEPWVALTDGRRGNWVC